MGAWSLLRIYQPRSRPCRSASIHSGRWLGSFRVGPAAPPALLDPARGYSPPSSIPRDRSTQPHLQDSTTVGPLWVTFQWTPVPSALLRTRMDLRSSLFFQWT